MSKIQKIFEADSDDTDVSDSEQSCNDECDLDEENDDECDDEAEEIEEEEEDDEKEDEEIEDEEIEEEDDDDEKAEEDGEENDEEIEEGDDEEDGDVNDESEGEVDFDDFEEGEYEKENEVADVEKADKTVIKKSKNFKNIMRIQAVQLRQKCIEHKNIREDGKKFLSKLFHGQQSDKIERLEKCLYNFCCRKIKDGSNEFKRCYSFELYSVMSNIKNKKTLNDIKDYYLEDVNHFERGTFEKEVIEDNKKLKLITHVSEPVAGIHKCRCGCDKVYSYELQTRSGDEGMTVFLQCYSCGRKWKL